MPESGSHGVESDKQLRIGGEDSGRRSVAVEEEEVSSLSTVSVPQRHLAPMSLGSDVCLSQEEGKATPPVEQTGANGSLQSERRGTARRRVKVADPKTTQSRANP